MKIERISDPKYVNEQYRDSGNLNARIRLHQECSVNKYGWMRWLFDRINRTLPCRVLELGCGTGDLWKENVDRMPEGMDVILSDLSIGMLDQARKNLQDCQGFTFKVINATTIPFLSGSFDLVIANHMLYHIPDRIKALAEIRRVLTEEGCLVASTIGKDHLREMTALLGDFAQELALWQGSIAESFTLENGEDQLAAVFSNIEMIRYPDALEVDDAVILLEYILSGRIKVDAQHAFEMKKIIEKAILQNNGKFHISKDTGFFVASGRVNENRSMT